MYIKLLKYRRIQEPNGKWTMHYPGQILDIKNKKLCKELIRGEVAVDMSVAADELPKGCGLVMRKDGPIPSWVTALEMEMATGEPRLPFPYTIIWHPRSEPSADFLTLMLATLRERAWDMAVPLYSYTKLTYRLGSNEERKATEKLVHDLRVPFYNTDLMFIKRNARTEETLKLWAQEKQGSTDEKLAFLRAVYMAKPFILPLPTIAIRRKQ